MATLRTLISMMVHSTRIAILLLIMTALSACHTNSHPEPRISAIAHASGGIDNLSYTNSIEALEHNYQRGFELFELDFLWTSDGHLICLHDWDQTPTWLLGYAEKNPLTLEQFNAFANDELNLTPCDMNRLNTWLEKRPNAFIVTDFKQDKFKGYETIYEQIIDAEYRVIPQFTQPEDYATVKAIGFRSLIWTLFSYEGSLDDLIDEVQSMDLFAITMPPNKAKSGWALAIKKLEIPTYVHTINDPNDALNYKNNWGLTSVYTDFLEIDLSKPNE